MSSKHTGDAENMGQFGPNESGVQRQNAPFRDLAKTGHDLNHTYKNPVAVVTNITKNHSYMHPHDGGSGVPVNGFQKANSIQPMMKVGTGKS